MNKPSIEVSLEVVGKIFDPSKSPLLRETLRPIPPLFQGGLEEIERHFLD
jgi:hypothetical protein